jgi:hypothetical protein
LMDDHRIHGHLGFTFKSMGWHLGFRQQSLHKR